MRTLKKAIWMGDSLKSLKEFPEEVKDRIGYALQKVQEGLFPRNAKLLKGLKPVTLEIKVDYNTNTYRVAYTIKMDGSVYVLHCFQKKSNQGIKTPKQEIDLIKQRLREAEVISQPKE